MGKRQARGPGVYTIWLTAELGGGSFEVGKSLVTRIESLEGGRFIVDFKRGEFIIVNGSEVSAIEYDRPRSVTPERPGRLIARIRKRGQRHGQR